MSDDDIFWSLESPRQSMENQTAALPATGKATGIELRGIGFVRTKESGCWSRSAANLNLDLRLMELFSVHRNSTNVLPALSRHLSITIIYDNTDL